MPRVVLDARAGADRPEHLQVVLRSLLEPLRFEQLSFGPELSEALLQLLANARQRDLEARLGRDEVLRR